MKIQKKTVDIGCAIDGHKISLPYYIINGKSKKSYVYIQGGIHGGENTYFIFHELVKKLEKAEIKNKIILVPVCNPYAWMQKIYYYTVGKFSLYNGKDFNRNFPGKKEGTAVERLAFRLSSLAKKSRFSIDLHTAGRSKPYLIVPSKEKKYLKIAKAANIPYTLFINMEEIKKKGGGMAFTQSEIKKGKTSVAFECGTHDNFNKENIKRVTDSLLNILCFLEIIKISKKEKGAPQKNYLIDKTKGYYAPRSGFVEYLLELEEEVKKGEPVYRLYSSSNVSKAKIIRAKEPGLIFLHANTHIVREGDLVIKIAPKKNIKNLP